MLNIVNTRESKFELLRIIAMALIVAYHVSGSISIMNLSAFDHVIIILFGSWGILGVNVFVLLSCYFFICQELPPPTHLDMSNGIAMVKGIWHKKIKKVVIQTFTYICAFTLLVPILTDVSMVDMLKVFITRMANDPLYADGYWFISAYIALQFTLPYLKKLPVSRELFIIDNILLFMSSQANSKGFIPAAVHFILIAIFLLHVIKIPKLGHFFHKYAEIGFLFSTIAMFAYTISMFYINQNGLLANGFSSYIGFFLNVIVSHAVYFHRCSYLIVVDSLFLFFCFLKMKSFKSKWVNSVALLMFGVYLFHQCPGYDIPNITVGELSKHITDNTLIFFMSVLLIMITGMVVETIRRGLFKAFNLYVL